VIVFVAGVHGAVKTFATKPAFHKTGHVHTTESQLITEERGQATWDAALIGNSSLRGASPLAASKFCTLISSLQPVA
jgi:hypothetical protein